MSLEGTRLGEFDILGRLGQGGMGMVYKGRQTALRRLVALKTLQPSLASDAEFVERFHNEAVAAAALSHPNLVQVFAAGQTGDTHWFAMEFVDGESVQSRLERLGRLSTEEAVAIVLHVAAALDYVWRKARMIHRDIKPDNIFLSSDGEVKLGDLGLAKSTTQDTGLSMTGATVGTPLYVSPEQAEGKRDLDLRSDIYSLGCTLFHLVCGAPPYLGESAVSVILKHVSAPIPDPHLVSPDVPKSIARVISRMMQKAPADRYADYDALSAALHAALQAPVDSEEDASAAAAESGPPSAGTPVGTAPSRGKGRLVLAILALGIVCGAAFFLSESNKSKQEQARLEAEQKAEQARKEAESKEAAARAAQAREAELKAAVAKEAAAREAAQKDIAAKEMALKEAAQREQALKESAAKEAAMRETAVRDAAAREAAMREAAAKPGAPAPPAPIPTSSTPSPAAVQSPTLVQMGNAAYIMGPAVALFDGKTFNGWVGPGKQSPSSDLWKISDNSIKVTGTGVSAKASMIFTEKSFENFVLEFEWRVSPDANSGVYYRGPGEIVGQRNPQYQILGSKNSDPNRAGSLVGVFKAQKEAALPDGQWNLSGIVAVGLRVEHWLNRELVCSYEMNTPAWKEANASRGLPAMSWGVVGLEAYAGTVEFRNIRVRTLKAK